MRSECFARGRIQLQCSLGRRSVRKPSRTRSPILTVSAWVCVFEGTWTQKHGLFPGKRWDDSGKRRSHVCFGFGFSRKTAGNPQLESPICQTNVMCGSTAEAMRSWPAPKSPEVLQDTKGRLWKHFHSRVGVCVCCVFLLRAPLLFRLFCLGPSRFSLEAKHISYPT